MVVYPFNSAELDERLECCISCARVEMRSAYLDFLTMAKLEGTLRHAHSDDNTLYQQAIGAGHDY
jgi:hypothetical protein